MFCFSCQSSIFKAKIYSLKFYWYDHTNNERKERQKVMKIISYYYGTKPTIERCSFKIAVPKYPKYKEK